MNFQGIQSWDFHRSQSRPVPKSLPLPVPFSSCSQIPAFQLDPLEVRQMSAGFLPDVRWMSSESAGLCWMSSKCPPDILPYVHQVSAGCSPDCPPDVRRFFRQMSGERRISVPKYGTMCILDMLFLNPGFRIVMKAIWCDCYCSRSRTSRRPSSERRIASKRFR